MNWIKALIARMGEYFRSGKAQKDAETALSYVVLALPYIDTAATIVTTLTPTGIDDAAWNFIRSRYPALFDGTPKSEDELKLFALAVASDLLKAKYPTLDTTISRAATQLAYIQYRSEK